MTPANTAILATPTAAGIQHLPADIKLVSVTCNSLIAPSQSELILSSNKLKDDI